MILMTDWLTSSIQDASIDFAQYGKKPWCLHAHNMQHMSMLKIQISTLIIIIDTLKILMHCLILNLDFCFMLDLLAAALNLMNICCISKQGANNHGLC